jgi:hypothetical protein
MKFLRPFAALSFCLLGSIAYSELAPDDAAVMCAESSVRDICKRSCAEACKDAIFLSENVTYCLENGMIGKDVQTLGLSDGAACVSIAQTVLGGNAPTFPTPNSDIETGVQGANASEDCSALSTLEEQLVCELAGEIPSCSPTVIDLEGSARLLVTEIKGELDQYGELLTRDWTDVKNRQALCAIPRATLNENYKTTQENPETLRTLRNRATDIQACQSEWETYLRNSAGSDTSDVLADSVSRDVEEQLRPLKGRITDLTSSVLTLQNAATTIRGIMRYHIIVCPAEGIPVPSDGG